jgi:hypothetical protein
MVSSCSKKERKEGKKRRNYAMGISNDAMKLALNDVCRSQCRVSPQTPNLSR